MAKLTNEAICAQLLSDKGLEMNPDNPNLVKVAQSLGILTEPTHAVRLVHNVAKQGEVDKPTDKSKSYLAITGGARGREAWFPVKDGKTPIEHVTEIMEACAEYLDEENTAGE